MTEKSPAHSYVTMTELVLPQHTNALGTVFGGVIMSWVDIAAATSAMRHCRMPVVTASIDALHFLAPIRLGWIVSLKACVNYVARTSCEVGVKIESENPMTGETFHTARAYLTFVAIDEKGAPKGIPALKPTTADEHRRYAAAEARRAARLSLKKELEARYTSTGDRKP